MWLIIGLLLHALLSTSTEARLCGDYSLETGSFLSGTDPKTDPFLGAVALKLVDGGDFVELAAGNPPHLTKLRLDFSSSELVFYEALSQRSQTYSYDNVETGEGSEIFYFDHYKLRLPLRFGASAESAHSARFHSIAHSGALGLASNSPLWRFWHTYALVDDELILGAPRINNEKTALLYLNTVVPCRVDETQETTLRLSLESFDTKITDPLSKTTLHLWPIDSKEDLSIALGTQSRRSHSGFTYHALKRIPRGATLTLGLATLREHSLHVDTIRRDVCIGKSVGASQRVGATTNLVLAALLTASALSYLLISLDTSKATTRLDMLRYYAHAVSLLICLVNALGLETRLLLSHYTHANATLLLTYVSVCALLAALLAAHRGLLKTPISRMDHLLIVSGCSPSLWLSLMARHDEGAGTLVLLLVSGGAALLLALWALDFAPRLQSVDVLAAVVTQLFFVAANAHALVRIDAREHRVEAWAAVTLLWAVVVATPALYLHCVRELARMKH